MSTFGIILVVILLILTVVLTGIILLQSDRAAGLGAFSGSGSNDTYWSRNKVNSQEGALERYTKIGGALFMIISLILNFYH